MARKVIPQKLVEESDRLFDAYMSQKQGPFSHDDLIAYVEKYGSKELLEYRRKHNEVELIR